MMNDSHNVAADERIAYLTMLEAAISRMGSDSHTMKLLAFPWVGGLITVGNFSESVVFFGAVSVVFTLLFWAISAKYLYVERGFRILFNRVAAGENETTFNMNWKSANLGFFDYVGVFVSWSVSLPYASLLFFSIVASSIGVCC